MRLAGTSRFGTARPSVARFSRIGASAFVQGPSAPGGVGNTLTIGGGWAWSNPSNAIGSDDARASNSPTFGTGPAGLICVSFGLQAATPTGIRVQVECSSDDESPLYCALRRPGGIYSDSKAIACVAAEAVYTVGGAGDLWGLHLGASELADPTFAVVVYGETGIAFGRHFYVDAVTITTYHAGNPPNLGTGRFASPGPSAAITPAPRRGTSRFGSTRQGGSR